MILITIIRISFILMSINTEQYDIQELKKIVSKLELESCENTIELYDEIQLLKKELMDLKTEISQMKQESAQMKQKYSNLITEVSNMSTFIRKILERQVLKTALDSK